VQELVVSFLHFTIEMKIFEWFLIKKRILGVQGFNCMYNEFLKFFAEIESFLTSSAASNLDFSHQFSWQKQGPSILYVSQACPQSFCQQFKYLFKVMLQKGAPGY